MISTELKELIHPVVLVQKIIWYAITTSVIFYTVFVYIFFGTASSAPSSGGGSTEMLIYIISIAAVAGSVYYRRYYMTEANINKFVSKNHSTDELSRDPRTKKPDPAKLSQLESLIPAELGIYALMMEFQKYLLINLALNEIVIVLGLALALLSDDPSTIIPFAVVSLVLDIWIYPKPNLLIQRVPG